MTIAAPAVEVHLSANEHSRSVGEVKRGQTYEVLSNLGNGWVKISTGNGDGYIKTSGKASLVEKNQETVDLSVRQRRQTVEFALQFLGGSYVFGVRPSKYGLLSSNLCFRTCALLPRIKGDNRGHLP